MYKGKSVLAVIPARSGSKGLPGKNIKLINGKPLVAWTIEQALHSKYLDRTILSTDCDEIATIGKGYAWAGCDIPFLRPEKLARDDSPMIDVLRHVINELDENYDVIVLLEPTSPLRKINDIDNAIEKLIDNNDSCDSLVSLGKIHLENPEICKYVKDNNVVPVINDARKITRRQQLKNVYFPYGVIYISKVKTLLESESFYQDRTAPYFIERWQNYEVDDIFDFCCIESIMKNYWNNNA